MKIAIIGTNGMLSVALTKFFYGQTDVIIETFGLDEPKDYACNRFHQVNLLKDKLDYSYLVSFDVVIYASGAGVQAALNTDPSLMYALNVNAPIEITLQLKKCGYKGVYISFGSYMEIGINSEDGKEFTENDVVCSALSVSNDYALSKRLYGRYMRNFNADFQAWHFILPNMFSSDDFKPGTRLIPYILQYIQNKKNGIVCDEPKFSAGTQTRQFIFLDEVMTVLQKAIENKIPSGIYNVGGGEFYSIRSLIERIFAFYNEPCRDSFFGQSVRRDGDIKSLRISGDKLYKAIGYLPSSKIEDVLEKFV
ncbi:MAG: NAD(P)-dependent oxidoreductase [Elusimicrobia bacterium]|nr:NAD(P)-dependent oxidoreductase [Elusimicrobiota bacterium]